jgi:hypothetical protein
MPAPTATLSTDALLKLEEGAVDVSLAASPQPPNGKHELNHKMRTALRARAFQLAFRFHIDCSTSLTADAG